MSEAHVVMCIYIFFFFFLILCRISTEIFRTGAKVVRLRCSCTMRAVQSEVKNYVHYLQGVLGGLQQLTAHEGSSERRKGRGHGGTGW